MSESSFFQDLAILMAVASIAAVIFSRLGWPKVLGYIAAGALMGPYTWGGAFLVDETSVRTIGELGVVFLMFGMGLSFSSRDMRKIRGVSMPSAIFDALIMIWLGYTIGVQIFKWSAVQSLFLGVAICDSATTLLAKVLDEMGWGTRPFAKYVLGTSVCEDILCVGAIAVATGCANGGGMSASAFALSTGCLFVFFLAVLIFGFILLPRLLQSIDRRHDNEALALAILGTLFGVSYLAFHFEFSLALGAFLVGLICSSSPLREKIGVLNEPLKAMFSAVFFVSIGLLVNPVALGQNILPILIVTAVVIVGKLFNNTFAALACGLDVKSSVQHGFALAQIGEFAFMVALLYAGLRDDANNPMFQIAIGTSLLTTLASPLMIRLSDRAGDWAENRMPARLRNYLTTYRTWLAKLGAGKGLPEYALLRSALIRLGIYAALMVAVFTVCGMLSRFNYARFSTLFEQYDAIIFFVLANFFSVGILPLALAAGRSIGDEISTILLGTGAARWQIALHQFVSFTARMAVLVAFGVEWTMLNLAMAPRPGLALWIGIGVILFASVFGWRLFVKAGRRATRRLDEALTAEERRTGMEQMTSIVLPEGTVRRFTLDASSPAIGATVVTLNVRAKTGATIVSVHRKGVITRNIGPDWEFAVGDTLVALGEPHQIAALKDLLGVVS